jgi:hypothetical protein
MKEAMFVCPDLYTGEKLAEWLFLNFKAGSRCDWEGDQGWLKPAYKVTFRDEALYRGFVAFVREVFPEVAILD